MGAFYQPGVTLGELMIQRHTAQVRADDGQANVILRRF